MAFARGKPARIVVPDPRRVAPSGERQSAAIAIVTVAIQPA
jgi:hypothetical protein